MMAKKQLFRLITTDALVRHIQQLCCRCEFVMLVSGKIEAANVPGNGLNLHVSSDTLSATEILKYSTLK